MKNGQHRFVIDTGGDQSYIGNFTKCGSSVGASQRLPEVVQHDLDSDIEGWLTWGQRRGLTTHSLTPSRSHSRSHSTRLYRFAKITPRK